MAPTLYLTLLTRLGLEHKAPAAVLIHGSAEEVILRGTLLLQTPAPAVHFQVLSTLQE